MKVQSTESNISSSPSKAIPKTNNNNNNNNNNTASSPPPAYPSWHNLIAGAAAGAGARFFTAPLDLIKIRRQLVSSSSSKGVGGFLPNPLGLFYSMSDVVRNEGGIASLFRGNLAATYLWIGYAAVQFSLYARTSDFITNTQFHLPPILNQTLPPPILPPAQHAIDTIQNLSTNPSAVAFCSGAIAGTVATLATYPFDICRTAFAARGMTKLEPTSIQSFFQDAARNSGSRSGALKNLFAGCGPAVLGIIPYMGINFALYDYLVRKRERTKAGDAGMAGAIAGGTSKFIVYPFDTVKKRLQAQAFNTFWGTGETPITKAEYKNMADCALKILKDEGFMTFYRGLAPTVFKTMGATGLTFAIFTFTKNTLETTHDWCVTNIGNNENVNVSSKR